MEIEGGFIFEPIHSILFELFLIIKMPLYVISVIKMFPVQIHRK